LALTLALQGCSLLYDGSDLHGTKATGGGDAGAHMFAFAVPATYPVGAGPIDVASGDFDGDGKPDLVVANNGDSSLTVLINQGAGAFAPAGAAISVCPSPTSLTVGDFNGDHNVDVAVVCDDETGATPVGRGRVLFGDGSGRFGTPKPFDAAGQIPRGVATADFDGDGHLDLAIALEMSGGVSVLYGNGDGTFARPAVHSTGMSPEWLVVADLDGDGNPDLAVIDQGSNNTAVLLNTGSGFQQAATYPTGGYPTSIAAADMNGDKRVDLITLSADLSSVGIALNQGGGKFLASLPTPTSTPPGPQALATADFDLDGTPDVAVGCYMNAQLALFANTGGVLNAGPVLDAGQPNQVLAADFNGDRAPDIALVDSGGTLQIFLNIAH
jgi:hypothetical protein